MANILLGKDVADKATELLIERVEKLKAKGIEPTLAIVRVGENEDDLSYERGALKRAERVGVKVDVRVLPIDISQSAIEKELEMINYDASIHGCLLFRPLPKHLNEKKVCDTLRPEKDVDGITSASMAGIFMGVDTGFAPCTAEAAMAVLKHNDIPIKGARAIVIGRSLVIGKPVAMMLLKENATVTTCHTRTVDLPGVTRDGDIIIACAGAAEMVTAEHVKSGQTIIDVGINFTDDGRLVGDVAFEEVEPIVENITPVPRGVGSVTTTILMQHVVEAAERASMA
ncbi:MAG: bifunctional 5,10-methylene-tetrahydrofolate dehydrogenase/5,10-methylene-tetrahydrofolate cyclohydrolase [Clostridiaceae bacterium]|jgi:methylenetetrahydrofolate dehydrogenase (NADP+)/methenyltetrahydrofolate cyclohydrolase|nr:bifunctional 5,10-methylene-tetrahydrofolate dehydrogenase/5,10-methylene-tetrahydrofolate cyclohydrolase [Clostridia bacterium]NMA35630.1 bifunctional 5,10-methylene-tetrahydrofolate dehydrogenase/5,10-methylene-tetrahydrofolate cyclohydrolase [Clostridiaceae bacterium]